MPLIRFVPGGRFRRSLSDSQELKGDITRVHPSRKTRRTGCGGAPVFRFETLEDCCRKICSSQNPAGVSLVSGKEKNVPRYPQGEIDKYKSLMKNPGD